MAITYSPASPVPGDTVELSSTLETTGRVARWFLTAAPSDSELELSEYLVNGAGDYVNEFVPDAAGRYAFTAYVYQQYSGVTSFSGDPVGSAREVMVASETGNVDVTSTNELPIVTTGGHGATLELRVNGTTITAASLVDPRSDASRVAALGSAVVSALAALVGQASTAIGGDIATQATDLRTKFEAHRVLTAGSVHSNADTKNIVQAFSASSKDYGIQLANELHDKILAHMQQGASASPRFHTVDDGKNVPLAARAVDLGSATVLLADMRRRVYERHRAQTSSPTVHGVADATNVLTAATLLENLIVAYLDALAVNTATVATGEAQGAFDLAQSHGFRSR